jgi:hypothetical protein
MKSAAKPGFAALLLAVCLSTLAAGADYSVERLPRAQFDVIPPAERVEGTRGSIALLQPACRIGAAKVSRRRIVDIAVQEWAVSGFQTVDATQIENRLLPPGIVPDSINPRLSAPRIVRQFPRLGTLEDDPRLDTTIAGYWSATPEGPRIIAEQNRAWNAPGGQAVNWAEPWSAAFVSWVMCEAGLGDMAQFRRSSAHRAYIDQAIAARDGGAPDAAFVAYDAGEVPIVPGDLLCRSRDGTNYRDLSDRRRDLGMAGATHCDIVAKLDDRNGRILLIGGNVFQSVSLTILPLRREAGHHPRPVDDSVIAGAVTVFAHLKLRADSIEDSALDSSPAIKALAVSPR